MSDEAPKKMRSYFHADVTDFSRALRHALTVVIIPLMAICVFCTVNVVLHYDTGFAKLLVAIVAGSVLFGMIFTFSAVYIIDRKKRRHARFTFFDILPQGMIFSEYAGEFTRYGDRIILRTLCYLPFADFESVSRNPKKAPHELTIKGKIRRYFFESDRLGYHISEDGHPMFDSPILNISLFEEVSQITIKKRFGNTKRLEAAILFYKDRFDNLPEKKPFNISDFVPRKRKRRPHVSNPALEAPSFSRKWN